VSFGGGVSVGSIKWTWRQTLTHELAREKQGQPSGTNFLDCSLIFALVGFPFGATSEPVELLSNFPL